MLCQFLNQFLSRTVLFSVIPNDFALQKLLSPSFFSPPPPPVLQWLSCMCEFVSVILSLPFFSRPLSFLIFAQLVICVFADCLVNYVDKMSEKYRDKNKHTCAHTYIPTHTYTYIHTHTHTCTHTHTHTHTHVYIQAHMCMRKYTRAHTYTHMHTLVTLV